MIDLGLWRAKIGHFHLVCVARFVLNRAKVKDSSARANSGEEQEDCVEVVRYVLETYIPEKTWDPDVIERAHRLGKPNSHNRNPHPIIAKFQRWGDAMRVMKDHAAREGMEKGGLRVAQDLTRRQAARLRDLRSVGKMGYFVNGKLRVKDQRDTVPREGMEKGGLRVAQDLTRRQAARLRDLRSVGKMGYFVNGKLRVKDQRDTVPREEIRLHDWPRRLGEADDINSGTRPTTD
ncbi:hypothetical protein ACOMHN_015287 [Nucella lapillus]